MKYGIPIISENLQQGSEAWLELRKGRATASEFSKITTSTGKKSSSAKGYMQVLTRECLIDDPHLFAGNKHTDWGNQHEPEARDLFNQTHAEYFMQEVGFCGRGDGAPAGCSPDGFFLNNNIPFAGLEIKCPQVDTHVQYMMDGVLPAKYKQQIHGSMAVTGVNSWFFMSYFPGLNPLIIRVERDAYTETLSNHLDDFVIEYAKVREDVLARINPDRATKQEEESIF